MILLHTRPVTYRMEVYPSEPVLVNPAAVETVHPCKEGSIVRFQSGAHIEVVESFEEIDHFLSRKETA